MFFFCFCFFDWTFRLKSKHFCNQVAIPFALRLQSVPTETESATAQTSSSGQFAEVIKSWPLSVSIYQTVEIVGHARLPAKIISGNVYGNKVNARMIEFSMQTGCVRPTLSLRIVCSLSKMCIISKKKTQRQMPSSKISSGDSIRQYEECLSQLFHEETANYSITLTTEEHL